MSFQGGSNGIILAGDTNKNIVDRKLAKGLKIIGIADTHFRKISSSGTVLRIKGYLLIDRS